MVAEPIKPALIQKVCTNEELAYVNSAPDEHERNYRFFEVWTSKEAYFKYIGTGITTLKSVNVLPHILSGGCIRMDGYLLSVFPNRQEDISWEILSN